MKFCPHCGGDLTPYQNAENGAPRSISPTVVAMPTATGQARTPYDQTARWKDIIHRVRATMGDPPPTDRLITETSCAFTAAATAFGSAPYNTIIHMVFDRSVVPKGGVLRQAAQTDGRTSMSVTQLETMGYLVLNGKVTDVDGVPVGPAYGAIDYWGGEKQFKRWHLTKPATINPSRNGNPFFMDEEMVAFGATWQDTLKVREALASLADLFLSGVKGDRPIAAPCLIEIDVIA